MSHHQHTDLLTTLFLTQDAKLLRSHYDAHLEQLMEHYPAADDDAIRLVELSKPPLSSMPSRNSAAFAPVRVSLGIGSTMRRFAVNREISHLMFLCNLVNVPPFFEKLRNASTDPELLDDFREHVANELYVLLTGIKDIGILAVDDSDRKYQNWISFMVHLRNAYLAKNVPYTKERAADLARINPGSVDFSNIQIRNDVLDECERKEKSWLTTMRP